MKNIRPFYVTPVLPEILKPLQDIAMNVWFSWNWNAVRLFIRIDAELWEEVYQNPVAMLGRVSQARYKELAQDESFVANLDRVYKELQEYSTSSKWFAKTRGDIQNMLIAYFSCEFGLDEGLPVYSGGLGVLSGDHLKTASDLGLPLVGIGLLYQQGYFRQRLNIDGWQLEEYPENDWYNMPVSLERNPSGEPVIITVDMGEKTVQSQIWRVKVGNVNLFLLDANIPTNTSWGREITTQLYGGDRDMRLRQELLLGIGGYRALKAMGMKPTVYHLNEGHSAFLILERIRDLMEAEKLTFPEAREIVWASNIFTTHTPVPAGNEQFQADILKTYLSKYIPLLKITWEEFLQLGRVDPKNVQEPFGMTVLALRSSAFCNGVSKLHGEVSRKMWNKIWEGYPVDEVPITHITNGIHTRSWLSHDMGDLFESYLGPRLVQKPWEFDVWDRIDSIPDVELWRTHVRRRERLVFFVRKRLRQQLLRRGSNLTEIAGADEVLHPHALTIGFSRRFATYKRAHLLFADPERLKKIASNPDRPVQFIFAGKAHPQDIPGKENIKNIIHFIREEPFRFHFVFLEDYDINVARYLVQGVDVWLNTPRRPLEASGTSGMKVAANGGLNLSILDGWWNEGYNLNVGWAIGGGEEYENLDHQDYVESRALYGCLENDVIPLFYRRNSTGLPRDWIAKMKNSIKSLGKQFNTYRMLEEYTELLYVPAHFGGVSLKEAGCAKGKEFSAWQQKIRKEWSGVVITQVLAPTTNLHVGEVMPIQVEVQLGNLNPDDVAVEVLCGSLDAKGNLQKAKVHRTEYRGKTGSGNHQFTIEIPCPESGRQGFAARVRPNPPNQIRTIVSEYVTWG